MLEVLNFEVWDATNKHTRGSIPNSTDSMRIVQYDSCRGLEGWTVFHYGFDEFWENKIKEGEDGYENLQNQVPGWA